MGGNVLTELYNSQLLKKKAVKNILSFLFLISFIATPVKASLQIGQNNINKEMYILGSELKRRYNIQGDIASNRKKLHSLMHDSWHYTFRLAYWLNSRYFGMPQKNISDEELLAELTRYNIDFYFYCGDLGNEPDYLLRHKELKRIKGLMEMEDIEDFSKKLFRMAKEYRVKGLIDYSKQLYDSVQSYELYEIEESLAQFKEIMKEIANMWSKQNGKR